MEYSDIEKKCIAVLENAHFAILATANKQGSVSTAQMCLINDGLTFYMQTDKKYEKVRNILENPNVSINCGAYSFKGTAKILDHPNNYDHFIEKLKAKHIKTYEKYSHIRDEVLIEIDLMGARVWGGGNQDVHDQETILIVDFKNKNTEIIKCDMV